MYSANIRGDHRFKSNAYKKLFIFIFIIVSLPLFSLTPIARWDVVPYQRIEQNKTFNAGIVAFSKEGIDSVSITVTGQGYNGANPQTTNEMKYNPRTGVFEYWVPLDANDFSSAGVITLNATIYGGDGDTRNLDPLSLVVNPNGGLTRKEVWVSPLGNDSSGIIGNSSWPFKTIGGAIAGIQAQNGGKADGGIVYLEEGTYYLGSGSVNTSYEWLTITKANEATREKTKIVGGGSVTSTKLLQLKQLTIVSNSPGSIYLANDPDLLWIDECEVNGSGRFSGQSNPTFRIEGNHYVTDSYFFDVDYGMHMGLLGRNVSMERIGNDPFVNVLCLINATVHDVDPGSTYWHADGYQAHTEPSNNRIIYGYYGTNMHYQGLFLRGNGTHTDNAFVNIFMEMRPPGRPGYSGGEIVLSSGSIYGRWDHLVMWHCSFPAEDFSIYEEPSYGFSLTNSSFVGNLFREYVDSVTGLGGNPPQDPVYSLPGNSSNNDFLYNHFIYSNVDQGGGGPTDPHWYSKSPDSSPTVTQSIGEPLIHLEDPYNDLFGMPFENSPLVNQLPFDTVPVDARGNPRDTFADIGAIELTGYSGTMPLSPPTQIRIK